MLNNIYQFSHYVTYITVYSGKLLPPFYIGSSSTSNVINNNYNGSPTSRKYKSIYLAEQKNNKHLFQTTVLGIFSTREEAFEHELKLQKELDVVKSKLFFNESYASLNGYYGRSLTGKDNHNLGKTKSKLTR